MNKGQSQPKPKIAGLDYLNFPTNETNKPHIYFAGARSMPLSWVMQPIISKTKATPTGSGKSKGGKSGKGGGGSKDYYGHCMGVVCQLQVDFIWGFLVNNDLAWPKAKQWNSQIYNSGRILISTDGNVYKASERTSIDPTPTPPAFPWVLIASPYAAGAYNVGDKVLYLGNVWQNTVAANSAAPGATIPVSVPNQRGIQNPELVNGWFYTSTPDTYSPSAKFWDVNSIVAWDGFIWTNTGGGTKDEPGTSGAWIRWKQDLTAIANPFKFTVPQSGDIYCYRGTPNQVLDTVNEQILSQFGHPPYRNKAGFMLHNFLFGTMQPNPSDMIAMLGRTPVQNLIVGASATMDARWQVNPWCVLAEILTHPVGGLGLPETWFDKATWQAEADRCMATQSLFYISPLYTNLSKVHELVADIMSYPDAFIFMGALRNLTAGHWPHNEAGPVYSAVNTIDVNSLIDEIQSTSDLWGGTNNSVQVSCSDASAGFTNRPAFAQNLFNLGVIKRMQSTNVDRPHITDFAQASKWATEFSKITGDLTMAGELSVVAEKAEGIQVGSIFLLTDDVLDISVPLRCVRRTVVAAPAGIVRLGYEVERGVAPQPYSPSQANPVPPTGPPPTRIQNFATIQLPSSIGPASSIAVLAGRTNVVTSQLNIWFRQSDAVSFQDLGALTSFAVPGIVDFQEDAEHTYGTPTVDNAKLVALNGGATITTGNTYNVGYAGFWKIQVFYSSFVGGFPFNTGVEGTDFVVDVNTGDLTILSTGGITTGKYVNCKIWKSIVVGYDSANTPQSDLDLVLESMTADEILDGKVLLICVQADNPALFEIMRVEQVVVTGLPSSKGFPTLTVDVARAQFGSLNGGDGTHLWGSNVNDIAFVLRKDSLVALNHESFAGFQAGGQTMNVRLVPDSAWEDGDITDVYDPATNPQGLTNEYTYQWSNIYAPTVTWGSLQKNGVDIVSFAAFTTADVLSFTFEIDDTNGDLIHAAMIAAQGDREITLWASNFSPSAVQNKIVTFSLPTGNWTITMRMLDASGNQNEMPLLFAGVPTTVYVTSTTANTPVVLAGSYHDKNGFRTGLQFGPLPSAAASFLVYYQLQDRDVAFNPASWIACADQGAVTGGNKWGDAAFGGTLPPIKKGSAGQTLYAYCTQTGSLDSAVVKWNF